MVIKPGDVVFVMHHDNLLSRVIAWFMGSKWSHSALVIEQGAFFTYLAETSDFNTTTGNLDRYLTAKGTSVEIWTKPDLTDKEREIIVRGAMENFDKVYGYLQLFLSLNVRAILRKLHIRIGNYIRQGWTCNEYVLSGLVKVERTGFAGINPKSIDTEEMHSLMTKVGWVVSYSKD